MNPLTNSSAIRTVVGLQPGHTAYWYSQRCGTKVRMNWLYAAFARSVKNGILISDKRNHTTVYFVA